MISPYIKNIREKIGHELLLLPSVTILCFDENNSVLLAKHSNNQVWVAPGGMIEPDETPTDAAKREMLEETGCEIELVKMVGGFAGPEFRILYQNGDETAYVMLVYIAKIVGGQIKPDGEEILEIGFFTYEETKQLHCGRWLPTVLANVFDKHK